ncbi:hypothetical protein EUX98_g7027 [Antrodiella citrinella]|uniref:Uncharacterized protein n=1 Tax=Antrodiella citrinella TaxID=2447956 RepID=A0A4S4MMQ5_9APHY|nr:hypothetical protein EUX98_g7027 [Antrodiella citrinella]
MSQNVVSYPTTELFTPSYSFLSHPPQKPQPSHPLPPPPGSENIPPTALIAGRRRSSIMISITAWAENVPPGSPAPPPRRKDSCAQSDEAKQALKAAGYTSAIVNLQNVVLPPPAPISKKNRYSLIPEPRSSSHQKDLRRSNSQSSLKASGSRTRSSARPGTATTPAAAALPSSSSRPEHRRERSQSTIMKDKQSKYAKYPPPLAQDMALAQLIDGGNSEDQIRKYVDARAKASGATKVNGQYVGADGVYRDGRGGVWRDQDEALEYTHLLNDTGDRSWVGFSKDAASLEDEYRRGSVSTMETMDSDLDPRYAIQPNDEELAKFGGAVPPHGSTRHSARHLRKSESLLDPFPVPGQNPSSSSASPPSSRERHRPAPLAMDTAPVGPSYVYSPGNPVQQEAGRKDFMNASFSPTPVTAKPVAQSKSGSANHTADVTKSKLGVKGLLKAVGMKK